MFPQQYMFLWLSNNISLQQKTKSNNNFNFDHVWLKIICIKLKIFTVIDSMPCLRKMLFFYFVLWFFI